RCKGSGKFSISLLINSCVLMKTLYRRIRVRCKPRKQRALRAGTDHQGRAICCCNTRPPHRVLAELRREDESPLFSCGILRGPLRAKQTSASRRCTPRCDLLLPFTTKRRSLRQADQDSTEAYQRSEER